MTFYTGVIEDRTSDSLKLGRCKVRVFGLHTADKVELPTADLPWAVVMQPVTSAATSGIGQSPTGLVEGAYVIVIFQDEHKQQPIIIGSIAGIPAPHADQEVKPVTTSESVVWTSSDGSAVTSSDGSAVTSGSTTEVPVTSEIKKPTSALIPSADCYNAIRDEESFSSLVEGKNKYIKYAAVQRLPDNQVIYPYQDTSGIWTIGWGSTYLIDSSKVTSTTRLTVAEANALFVYKVDKDFAAGIRRNLKAPVTQSMFDALVAMSYNAGVGGLTGSAVFSAVNSTDYEQAAAQILMFKTNNGVLSARRTREKTLFSKDGFPRKDMTGVDPAPETATTTPDDATQNPVVKVKPGKGDSNQPTQTQTSRQENGFRDPNGVYPTIVNEPDTHRLARHEKIDQTIVFSKEAARAKNVVSGGSATWSQPTIPYNAKYPFNQARVTESGHVQEFDDTKGSERIHTYHRSGTYEEVDVNGTRVNRIVGDDYEILERNGHVLVRGTMNVTIVGNSNVRIENDSNIDVLGDVNMTVGGNMNTGVSGDYIVTADGNARIIAAGNISFDAARIDYNSQKGSAGPTGKGSATGAPEFSTLVAPSRHDSDIVQYDSPDDGDSTSYVKKLEASGAIETPVAATTTEVAPKTKESAKPVIPEDCSLIPQTGTVDRGFKLSTNFTLAQMDPNNVIDGKPAISATKAELICNMKGLAENCLEPVKKLYPNMKINSGYRNNVPAGGAAKSDHMYGAAADIGLPGFSRAQYYAAAQEIAKILPAWTQLILESAGTSSNWIHIAYNPKKSLKMDKFTMHDHKTVQPFGQFILVG